MSKALADRLFKTITLSVYGHDKAVLQSYTTFVKVYITCYVFSSLLFRLHADNSGSKARKLCEDDTFAGCRTH